MSASFDGLAAAWPAPRLAPWYRRPHEPGSTATPQMVLAAISNIRAEAGIIHCLQAERGVSCVTIASGSEQSPFSISLDAVRTTTDETIANSRLNNPPLISSPPRG